MATATPDVALTGALSPAATFPSDAPTVDTGNNIGKNNFSKTSSKKNTVCDCILILGDSRACSLIKALWDSDDYESLYYYADRTNAIDAICQKGNRMIVICAEPGGSIASGAVERAAGRMLSLLNSNANLRNQKSYTFFNMFGLNDCILDKASASGYLSFDSNLIGNLPYCTHVYQLNAGPVCQNMNPVPDDAANAIIEKYNKGFKNTNDVTIVDLYTFLTTSGYHTEFSQIDVSGLHYDAATNVKIINYIIGIAGNVVSPVPNSSMGIPSALQITPAAAATPSIAPIVSPVISTADSTTSPAITPDSFKY